MISDSNVNGTIRRQTESGTRERWWPEIAQKKSAERLGETGASGSAEKPWVRAESSRKRRGRREDGEEGS